MKVQIDKEYQDLVYPLEEDDYKNLHDSIQKDGLWVPIIVNQNGIILDGHHRYWICRQLKIDCQYIVKEFEDKNDEAIFVIDCNKNRRQLTTFQKVELELRKKPYIQARSKQGNRTDLEPFDEIIEKLDTNQVIAKASGVSRQTVDRVEDILEAHKEGKITDEELHKTRTREASIQHTWTELQRSDEHTDTPELPQGQFNVLLADPPWKYEVNLRGTSMGHYQVMDIDEIQQLSIPAADNAILFLWATGPKLQAAFSVMDAWGFTYKTQMVWVKDKIGNGYYVRAKHELLLIGVKGDMPLPETDDRPASVIEAPRLEHSQKPEIVYDIIEKMYPNRKYLELFARSQHSDKWVTWGIEAPKNDS